MLPALLAIGGGAAGGALLLWRRATRLPATARKVLGYVAGAASPMLVVPVAPGEYMRADAARALGKLLQAASKAGHALTVTSAWRSQEEQAELHRRYLAGTGNLAAKPGYSNHQGGVSVDLGGVLSFTSPAYAWLKSNAGRYGYVNDVASEHWHWTFKGAVSAGRTT